MNRTLAIAVVALAGAAGYGAEPAGAGKVWDDQLKSLEGEFVPLVEAMPADRFEFAPTGGAFKSVRTFRQQAMHAATILYVVGASILEEKPPVDAGATENGPELKSKEEVVKYVKDGFAYAHRAMASLSADNQMGMVKSAFGGKPVARMYMASVALWHTFDHYGQMVVYARMNNVVPPGSR